MQSRQRHWPEVESFLQKNFAVRHWTFTLPSGSGHETYFVHGGGQTYFVKIGVQVERYQSMASAGLTPPVLAVGQLEDGASLLAQVFVTGRTPTRKDYHACLEQVALILHKTHHNLNVSRLLPAVRSNRYQAAALDSLALIRERWERCRPRVSAVAQFVDGSLDQLAQQISHFSGSGLVASHNDICNANWLVTSDDRFYLIDLESMSLEDPACDLGAMLWWYYPPVLRQRFLEIVEHDRDPEFQVRMQVRMAMHCLHITLPRENSFDVFEPDTYDEALTDFRAILAGHDNPQGYDD
jgi:thiamine kinase-like enzyme